LTREAGCEGQFVAADCLDRKQIEAAFASIIEEHGHIDISVSVVGGGKRGPFLDESVEEYEKTINMTQNSHWHWQQVAARHMCKGEESTGGQGGCLILIGSIMSQMSIANCLPYQASKVAVRSMGRTLAHELGPYGVRVNVVEPGYIDTPGAVGAICRPFVIVILLRCKVNAGLLQRNSSKSGLQNTM
jgi:NAD(P)-dependent dehydrogenase (short-subunit alcohol dehydrogenase family)